MDLFLGLCFRAVDHIIINTLYTTPRKSMFIAFMGRAQNHRDLRALKKFKFLCNERLFRVFVLGQGYFSTNQGKFT